jgi:hypothetical protein
MVVFLGEGYAMWRRVVGLCLACPGDGGEGEGGGLCTQILITCLCGEGLQGTSCSLLMIRVGRPWNLLLLLMGPRPLGFFSYLLVLLTRLFFNLHTAYSDVGGTDVVI